MGVFCYFNNFPDDLGTGDLNTGFVLSKMMMWFVCAECSGTTDCCFSSLLSLIYVSDILVDICQPRETYCVS
jgi:hypothetical protein